MSEQEIEIVLYEGLNNTPALQLAIRGWCECEEKGYGNGEFNAHPHLSAFVASVKQGTEMVAIGVITFDVFKLDHRAWIFGGYVIPELRGRGVYNMLWERLLRHVRSEGCKIVESGISVLNNPMREVARKQGRREMSVTVRYEA